MKKIVFVILFSVTFINVFAQMRLSLDEAVELALNDNPTIEIANMEVQRYDYVKRQTWGNLLPQVSATGLVNHSFVVQQMSRGFSLGSNPFTNISGAVDVAMPLFVPQIYRMMRLNDKQMAAAVEAARGSRIALVTEVKRSFYNILLAEQSLKVLRASEATVQRTVDDTALQYEHGLASEYDLLTAQVQLSNLKPAILQMENSVRLSKLLLKMYLSIPEEVNIDVEGELILMRDMVLAGSEGFSTDISENSDLRMLELQEELLQLQMRTENASRLPSVSAFGSFTMTGNNMGSVIFDPGTMSMTSVRDGYFWQHPVAAGIRVSIPIFGGLIRTNRSREIKNQISQIGVQRDYAREQLRVQVRAALNDLLTARETMFSQERTVVQAEKAYYISDTRFRAGAGTILELNTAQLAQTQAQLNLSQAIYDYLSAKAEYDRIIGRER